MRCAVAGGVRRVRCGSTRDAHESSRGRRHRCPKRRAQGHECSTLAHGASIRGPDNRSPPRRAQEFQCSNAMASASPRRASSQVCGELSPSSGGRAAPCRTATGRVYPAWQGLTAPTYPLDISTGLPPGWWHQTDGHRRGRIGMLLVASSTASATTPSRRARERKPHDGMIHRCL